LAHLVKRRTLLGHLVVAIAGGCAAVLVAGAVVLAAGGAAERGGTAAAACTSGSLVVWLNTQGDGTAGSIYYTLEFTNLSGRACSLHGYPGVSAVGLGGQRLGSPASRNPLSPVRVATLQKGATAKAVLQITEAGNFPSRTCGQTTAAGLRVYPPNQTAAKIVPFPFAACARSGPVYLHVAPVT
jgi:Protein of unknown function (DUF4232)